MPLKACEETQGWAASSRTPPFRGETGKRYELTAHNRVLPDPVEDAGAGRAGGHDPPSCTCYERLLGSEQRIISVTAPGGYGKSLLLAQWASDDPRPLAWLSLDPDDSDTTLFLQYVALALVHAEILEADQLPGSVGMANARSLLPALRAALATSPPFVLMVDDTQWLRGDALDALLLLARDIPHGSQLVLCGRSDLGRLLSRARLGGETLELTAADLALDDSEARELFVNAGIDLSDAVVSDTNRQVEGWAAGLYLCALAMRETGSLPDFGEAHTDRFVSDYFEEDLARLPESQLDFLRESSVLTRMCPELCDAALSRSDSRRMLEEIEKSNLFLVPLDHERVWFRYHDLFRAALQRELEKSDAGAGDRIRLRASEWCEVYGSADRALRYALAAGDNDRAARLLCTVGLPLYQLGRAAMLEECFARFDDPMQITRYPAVSVLAAFFHTLSGRPFQAERWADAAERGLREDDPLPDGSPNASLWVATIEALMCRHGPDQMRRGRHSAIAGLPRPSPMLGLAVWTHATSFLLTGDLVQGERHLAAMIEVASATGNRFAVMNAQAQRALLSLDRGDVDGARMLLGLARPAENIEDYQGYIHFALIAAAEARVEVRSGNVEEAIAALAVCQRLRPLLTRAIPWYSVQTLLEMAEAYCDLGEVNAARAALLDAVEILRHRPDLGILGQRVRQLQAKSVSLGDGHAGWEWSLTTAELRLLPLLMTHLTLSEIAERLDVSYNTVKTQTASIYRKLDVSSRSAAVQRAAELGLLEAVPV